MGNSLDPHFRLKQQAKFTINQTTGKISLYWVVVSVSDPTDVRQLEVLDAEVAALYDLMVSACNDNGVYVE